MSKIDIFRVRVLRLGKLTLALAGFILVCVVIGFNKLASILGYMMFMTNALPYSTVEIINNILRFGIAFIILVFYIYYALSGEWDLNFKLICRHKVKDQCYEYIDEYNEKIESIQIYRDKKYTDISVLDLLRVYELERQKCLFCKINNHYMLLRDVAVRDINGQSLKIKVYKYNKKSLVNNKNLFGYEYSIDNTKDEQKILETTECDKYFKHSMEMNEDDIKDSFMEDMKDSVKTLKIVCLLVGAVGISMFGSKIYKNVVNKAMIEASGVIVESANSGVKIIFDRAADVALLPKINANLAQIDEEVLNKFNKEGWKIRITTEDLRSDGYYFGLRSDGMITGATSFECKYITIPNTEECIDASVIHEMGHVIDHWKYTMTSEWIEIYNKEKDKYIRDYAKTNQFEGFACAYMEYVIVNESLKHRCPETYEYIDKIIQDIKVKYKDTHAVQEE